MSVIRRPCHFNIERPKTLQKTLLRGSVRQVNLRKRVVYNYLEKCLLRQTTFELRIQNRKKKSIGDQDASNAVVLKIFFWFYILIVGKFAKSNQLRERFIVTRCFCLLVLQLQQILIDSTIINCNLLSTQNEAVPSVSMRSKEL